MVRRIEIYLEIDKNVHFYNFLACEVISLANSSRMLSEIRICNNFLLRTGVPLPATA